MKNSEMDKKLAKLANQVSAIRKFAEIAELKETEKLLREAVNTIDKAAKSIPPWDD